MVHQSKQLVSHGISVASTRAHAAPVCSFRSVRNFVIDLRQMPATANATGLHWQVSQATSLFNVVVEMSTEPGNIHQGIVVIFFYKIRAYCLFPGIFMENGRFGHLRNLKGW
jgi:hypothetical protein